MSNKYISVIIVTFKKGPRFEACLESINQQDIRRGGFQTRPCIEIIIIDNSLENIYYAKALNKGIKQAKGDYILCLNDDVVLDSNFISEALKGFEAGSSIGSVSGKILRQDKRTIDSTGLFLSLWRTAHERGYNVKDAGQFNKPGYIFGVSGAVAFYSRKMLESVKLKTGDYFDSSYDMFYEDLDIAWRAQKAGWKAYYIPTAVAYHVRGGSARTAEGIGKRFARFYLSDELHASLIKNRYKTIKRNETAVGFLLHLPFIVLYELAQWVYILIKNFLVG